MKRNVQVGSVRLVFVADEMLLELLRTIKFMKQQMDFAEVLAVDITEYTDGRRRR